MPHLLVLSYSGKFSGVCITRQFAAFSIITEKTALDKAVFVKFKAILDEICWTDVYANLFFVLIAFSERGWLLMRVGGEAVGEVSFVVKLCVKTPLSLRDISPFRGDFFSLHNFAHLNQHIF